MKLRRAVRAALASGVAMVVATITAQTTDRLSPTTPGALVPALVLFNGRDLTGWTVFLKDPSVDPKTVWSAADGVLHLTGKPNGYLRTEKSFSNYHLHAEWRWAADASPKSNSGVFVHVHGPDAIWPGGVECQLASGNAGQLVGTDVDLPGAPVISKKQRAPKLADSSEKPFGEWNTYEIYCRGDSIEVFVNGVRQNRVEKVSVTAGAVGLQMEGYPVDFRNVWLAPL
jgi:Domain of Unknown Function (DUF1080)